MMDGPMQGGPNSNEGDDSCLHEADCHMGGGYRRIPNGNQRCKRQASRTGSILRKGVICRVDNLLDIPLDDIVNAFPAVVTECSASSSVFIKGRGFRQAGSHPVQHAVEIPIRHLGMFSLFIRGAHAGQFRDS